ncbi:hypothetical protein [Streptomyces sp. NPDC096132]|uniref:hypothetical protein n=1 Tax=Streptomyces sp. NPDC096132 TaxID=3366075 RepID=UPI0038174350
MSRPGEKGAPPVRPIVYHPNAETDPSSYEQYADPAAAHGWQNAYDETQQLPRVPGVDREPGGGRADRRRAARRTGGLRSRRVVFAAGAVGAVSLAALVAGMSFTSGSSSEDRQGGRGDTRSATGDTVTPSGDPSGSAGSAGASASASAGASAAPSSGGTASKTPSAGSSAGAAGSPTADATPSAGAPTSASSTPASEGNPGRGRGKGGGKSH